MIRRHYRVGRCSRLRSPSHSSVVVTTSILRVEEDGSRLVPCRRGGGRARPRPDPSRHGGGQIWPSSTSAAWCWCSPVRWRHRRLELRQQFRPPVAGCLRRLELLAPPCGTCMDACFVRPRGAGCSRREGRRPRCCSLQEHHVLPCCALFSPCGLRLCFSPCVLRR